MINNKSHIDLGREGEDFAVQYLLEQHYEILWRNYRTKFGEIDVVARDSETICFVEVKTRTDDLQGHPLESITPSKKHKLKQSALYLLQEEGLSDEKCRFDCIAIVPDELGQMHVELVKDAFELGDY